MSILLAFPVLFIALLLQMTIVSRLPLLNGTADLVLLVLVAWSIKERVRTAWVWAVIAGAAVSFISAMPFYLPLVIYLLAALLARLLQNRVWQMPFLALFVAVFAATVLQNVISIAAFQFLDWSITWQQGLSLVTLPSLLLNLLLALPVYTVVSDLANWLYPPVEE